MVKVIQCNGLEVKMIMGNHSVIEVKWFRYDEFY